MLLGYLDSFLLSFPPGPWQYFGNWIKSVTPAKYHDKIVPNYPPGCKRTVVGSYYLPALHRPNVRLNWDGIEQVTENGIVTKKGEKFDFDIIILATGFITDDYAIPIHGTEGPTIKDYYNSKGGPAAYLGTTIPGFPNFYMINGPNTVTGHGSTMFTTECQINLTVDMAEPVIKKKVASFCVKDEPTDTYNDKIQGRLAKTVYPQCASWYRAGANRDGRITNPWPGTNAEFWWITRTPVWSHYDVIGGKRWIWERRIGNVVKLFALLGLLVGIRWASVPANKDILSELWRTHAGKVGDSICHLQFSG